MTILLVAALVAAAVWYWTRPQPVPVMLQKIDRGRVEASVANTRAGTVEACERAKMAPPTGGQVASISVRAGDRVRANQVLLSLWNEDRKAELKLAESELVASRAKTEEACALAESAEREAQRLLKLQKSRLVAEDQIDKAMADAEARKAACRAGRATEQQSLARIEVVRAALERTILRAPFAGVVAEVNAKLGEYVTPSPPGIPTLPAIDLVGEQCLYVSAPIDEVDAPAIRPGQTTRITLDAFAGRDFKGKVRRVAPYVLDLEKQARTVEVEATFTDSAETANLLPGYSADIEVILDSRADVLRVPTEAVLEGYRVLVFQPDTKRLKERRFKPGLANWKYTAVLEGLHEGELIVLSVAREG
ncbi:MAG: efflux RND transporter periplasmic adaptor subunit, partial [Acidiferrobacterales bacterium]|nr:efflux RND transporter periplasmic adaptor subunit [Acidiferrobacterales bacterium]